MAHVQDSAGPGGARRLMTVLVSLYAVAYLDRSIIGMVAPALQSDLGISATQLGLLQGLGFALFYSVLGLPLGTLVDRMSRRLIIFAGVMCWSICASLSGFASNFWQLLAARFGVGAGEAALSPAGYSMIADSVPRIRLAYMSSIFGSGSGIGSAISVALGGALMSWAITRGGLTLPLLGHLRPWQVVLFATGLPGLVLAPAIFLVREPARRDRIIDDAVSWSQLLSFMAERRRFFIRCFGGVALWQAMIYSVNLWVPTRFVKDFGWSYADVGLVLAITMLSAPIGIVLVGRLISARVAAGHVTAPLTIGAAGTIFTGLCFAAGFSVGSPAGFVLLLTLAYMPTGLLALGATTLQMIAPNQYRGRLTAIYVFVTTLSGAGLGPVLPALLAEHGFGTEARISESVAIVSGVVAPLAALLLLAAVGPMRHAYAAAAAWQTAPDPV